MPDIIVTTPDSAMTEAVENTKATYTLGPTPLYFWRFPFWDAPTVTPGNRVYFVENGHVRGFAEVESVASVDSPMRCAKSGITLQHGKYVYMRANTWRWILPIKRSEFTGFMYARKNGLTPHTIEVVGGWLDPKPAEEANEGAVPGVGLTQ